MRLCVTFEIVWEPDTRSDACGLIPNDKRIDNNQIEGKKNRVNFEVFTHV